MIGSEPGMKILFVYPNINTGNGPHYVHGLGSLISVCRQAGCETGLLYLDEELTNAQLDEISLREKPNIVAFGFTTHQVPYVEKAARVFKSDSTMVLAGGVHATFAAEEMLEAPGIDLVVRGEGEKALLSLIEGNDPESIPNVQTKSKINECANLIENLDDLPLYDRSDFPMDKILASNGYEMTLLAGRGCPWPCTYCCNHAWKNLYRNKGQFVRLTSCERIFEQIALLAGKYRIESLYFEDDIFSLDPDWVEEFCTEYPKHFSFPLKVYLRVGSIDKEILGKLYAAGCRWAQIGIESGSQELRNQLLKRKMDDKQIVQLFEWCKELGILTRAFNIIGFPGETTEQIDETIQLNERIMSDEVQVSVFHPYPGTELHGKCIQQGLYDGKTLDSYFSDKSVLNQDQLSAKMLSDSYRKFSKTCTSIEIKAFLRKLKQSGSLLNYFSDAMIGREDKLELDIRRIFIGPESRYCLFAHPRSSVTFPGVDCTDKNFVADLALDPICLDWGGEAVRYSLEIKSSSGSIQRMSKTIDPKKKVDDRGWIRWAVALPDEGKADLTLATDPYPGDDLTGAWALWGEPRLEDES